MKIESHNITYTTDYEFSYEKTDTFKKQLATLSFNEPIGEKEELASMPESDLVQRIKFALIQKLLHLLFGDQEQTTTVQDISQEECSHVKNQSTQLRTMKKFDVEYESTYKESQSLAMKTQGTIKTKDGRSIDINLDISMKRSFYSQTTITESVFIDPLVVSFDGTLPDFKDTTFSFDIDCDGVSDQISCLAKNSGFLALDTNKNGLIDDGSELFGTKSGNAFKDLSAYDKDGNNWIDENDAIFDGLRIWSDDKLLGLGEVGLGAIYLGATNSPYTYKNDDNQSIAKLRQNSIFLYESGDIGTIAQVDFAKQKAREPLREILSKV